MLPRATENAVAGHIWSGGRYLPTPVLERQLNDRKSVLFNPCNKPEEATFGRLRSCWESFLFRIVCEPKT